MKKLEEQKKGKRCRKGKRYLREERLYTDVDRMSHGQPRSRADISLALASPQQLRTTLKGK